MKIYRGPYVVCLFLVFLCCLYPVSVLAADNKISCSDALILLLYPEVEVQVYDFYKEYFYPVPRVSPYSIELADTKRTPGESGAYSYTVTLEATPYIAAHIDVGLDQIIFELNLDGVKSVTFNHLKSEKILPPWQHFIINPLES